MCESARNDNNLNDDVGKIVTLCEKWQRCATMREMGEGSGRLTMNMILLRMKDYSSVFFLPSMFGLFGMDLIVKQ